MKKTTNYNLNKPEPLVDNVDIEIENGNMDIIDQKLKDLSDNKIGKPGTVTATLLSTAWVGSAAPFTQAVAVSGITATSNVLFDIGMSPSQTQYQAAADAYLKATAQGTNTITITAFGEKPTINIPIQFMVLS